MGFQQSKNINDNSNIPEEVLELLPWYATGKLSIEDKTFFEIALSKYSSLEKELKQELALIKTVSNNSSLLDLSITSDPEQRLKSVFNMIDNEEALVPAKKAPLLKKLKNAFDALISDQIAPSYARFASVGLLVLSVAAISTFVVSSFNETSDFTLASASSHPMDEQTTTTSLLVGFNDTHDQLENIEVLKEKLMKIETAPDGTGFYQIRFKKVLSPEEIKQTLEALQKEQELVWFAGEVN